MAMLVGLSIAIAIMAGVITSFEMMRRRRKANRMLRRRERTAKIESDWNAAHAASQASADTAR